MRLLNNSEGALYIEMHTSPTEKLTTLSLFSVNVSFIQNSLSTFAASKPTPDFQMAVR